MKHNLLETFDKRIKPELFEELKRENPSVDKVTYQHLTLIHASIVGGLIDKVKKDNGAKTIKNLIEKGNHNGEIINLIPDIFGSEKKLADVKKLGNSLLAFVFDDGADKAFEKIQHFLSEKYQTTEEDLIEANRMIAPFSFGLIGRIVHQEEMDEQQITDLLVENKPYIGSTFPGLAKVLGITPPTATSPSKAPESDPYSPTEEELSGEKVQNEESGSSSGSSVKEPDDELKFFIKALWPWIAIFAVSGLSLFLLKKFESKPVESKPDNPFNFFQSDSLIQDNERTYTLPGNVLLKVDKFSTIDSLMIHLDQNQGHITDTLLYIHPAITFQDSSAVLTPSANKVLATILSIFQSYPDLKMDIHIFYDSTFQNRKPIIVNKQINNLENYFTVFGINSNRLKITAFTLPAPKSNATPETDVESEPDIGSEPDDRDSSASKKVSLPKLVHDKKVELLFYDNHEIKVDSLNIQE